MSKMHPGACVGCVAQEKGLNCVSGPRSRRSKKPERRQTGQCSCTREAILIALHRQGRLLEVFVSPVPFPEGTREAAEKCSDQECHEQMVCLKRPFQPWLIRWGWVGEAGVLAVSQTGSRVRTGQQK